MNLEKEIARLKRENKKLKEALNDEGIEPETEVLGKKASKVLTGKELKIAAEKGLKVRYVVKMHNPQDNHMNFNEDCVMEKIRENDYYIGNADISLNEFEDDAEVLGDFDEGTFEVRRSKGVKYI